MRSVESTIRACRRIIPALGCALALGACTTWVEAPAPATVDQVSAPLRIIRNDGFAVVLHDAYVKGETLYGHHSGAPLAIPLREVKATRRRELDPFRGFGVLAVGAVVAFGVYAFATIIPIGGS